MTVGDLRRYLETVPDDFLVAVINYFSGDNVPAEDGILESKCDDQDCIVIY